MSLIIIILPILGAIISGLGGNVLGGLGVSYMTSMLIGVSLCLSVYQFYSVALLGAFTTGNYVTWFNVGLLECSWGIYNDTITTTMLVVVTGISLCVHIYSIGYMSEDPHRPRFMAYLSLFTSFMLFLVTSNNFLQLFVGWEGVGLCSYLLINFWFTRIDANKAAMKAIIVNRIGDFGLTLGLLAIFNIFESLDFITVFALVGYLEKLEFYGTFTYYDYICLTLFIGAIGKSAQIGLHTWLPDAMEGPTPVSALIHAATMVTAGVFLLIRCSPIFQYSSDILYYITIIGALTAFFAATSGFAQFDIKKIVAYSTCSQLGYMIFACGLSSYSVSLFHLSNHAFFKALLFLSCGSVIHAINDEQDIRRMGGLVSYLPFTSAMFFIGSLALTGFPFLSGYYSKDVILEIAFSTYHISGLFAAWLGTFSAFFTAFYSFRLFYYTFLCNPNGHRIVFSNVHDAPILMAIPLIFLAFFSLFLGYVSKDFFIGLGSDSFQGSLSFYPYIISAEFLPISIKLIPLIFTCLGAIFAFFIYYLKLPMFSPTLFRFFNQKWHFDNIYSFYFAKPTLYTGYHFTFLTIDRGFLEIFGPTGLIRLFSSLSSKLATYHSGYIYHISFIFVLSIFLSLLLFNFSSFLSIPFYLYFFFFLTLSSLFNTR